MKTVCVIIAVVVLSVLAMYFIKKLVETAWNIAILHKASKDKTYPARFSSSGMVLNKKTKKLEACGDKISLPF